MPAFKYRSNDPEIMDDLKCSGEVVNQTLREIDYINKTLGGNALTLQGINKLIPKSGNSNTLELADIGCGSGAMLLLIKRWADKNKLNLKLTGIDANPHIITYAKNFVNGDQIQLEAMDILSSAFQRQKYDIITATLFLHHFGTDQLAHIFSTLQSMARLGIVVNDLHRHPIAYYAIRLLTVLLSRSAMVRYDAPLSVLRGFRRKELTSILQKAGIKNYELQWKWAFRWQLVIFTQPR